MPSGMDGHSLAGCHGAGELCDGGLGPDDWCHTLAARAPVCQVCGSQGWRQQPFKFVELYSSFMGSSTRTVTASLSDHPLTKSAVATQPWSPRRGKPAIATQGLRQCRPGFPCQRRGKVCCEMLRGSSATHGRHSSWPQGHHTPSSALSAGSAGSLACRGGFLRSGSTGAPPPLPASGPHCTLPGPGRAPYF